MVKSCIKLAVCGTALTLIAAPVSAQETVVEGFSRPIGAYTELVEHADLDLRNESAQAALISRVKQASKRVCRLAYAKAQNYERLHSDCPQRSYSDAKPQIASAIARASDGRQIAMGLIVAVAK